MDEGIYLVAEALQRSRRERGWSASDLARAAIEVAADVGEDLTLSQQAISQFENKKLKSTPRWLRFAEVAIEIAAMPAWQKAQILTQRFGQYQPLDVLPSADALNAEASWILVRVPLPSEAALAEMFEAQLRVFDKLRGAELARALAKRLPTGLGRLQGQQVEAMESIEGAPAPLVVRRAARQAPRK